MENVTQDKAVAALSESGGTMPKGSQPEMTQVLHGRPRVGFRRTMGSSVRSSREALVAAGAIVRCFFESHPLRVMR